MLRAYSTEPAQVLVMPSLGYTKPSKGGRGLERQDFDQHYLDKLHAGDPQTEAHFCNYFGQLLGLKLRNRLRSPQAIEDVRQETFVRVFALIRKETGIRHPERLGALVNSVCNNVLLESYRSSYRDGAQTEFPENMPARERSPLEQVEQSKIRDQVRGVLKQLPERDRGILTSLFLDEAEKDEVCQRFGVDRDYLRVLVFRAKQVFRQHFGNA
jgi:RNA polymerase sigma-70 factor (ECF subfamily)